MSESSRALGSAVLLAALLLATTSAVAAAQGRLVIKLDGIDREWDVSGWVCPGRYPCQVPTTANTAWLCCNTTGTPRECQLVWNDDPDHLEYVRFYLNETGLYAYVRTRYHHNLARVNITLTVRDYTLNITIGTGFGSARYRLFERGTLKKEDSLTRFTDFNFSSTKTGEEVRGIEVAFRFHLIKEHFTPRPSDEYALKIVIMRGRDVPDVSGVCRDTTCSDMVRLLVEGYKIKEAFYVVGGQRHPVPIPEPGVLVSAAAVATALGAIAFVARRK